MKKFVIISMIACIFAAVLLIFPGWKNSADRYFSQVKNTVAHYLPIENPEDLYIRQMITEDAVHSRTIMWETAAKEEQAVVEYREKDGTQIQTVPADNEEFTDDQVTTFLHTVNLTLEAQKEYEYRVGAADKRSPWYPMSTMQKKDQAFKAIIFPDSQSNDYTVWKNTAESAWAKNPDAAFFVNMGDLVDNGEDHSQWRGWFSGAEKLLTAIPFAGVQGNHETYNLNWKVRMPEAYLHLFSFPGNGNQARKNEYYSFDYGDVHFVVLNTQIDEMESLQPGLLAEQKAWLQKDLSTTQKKWKVALMHKDVLTYAIKNREDRKAGISDIGREFMPLFDQYGVDAVLTAHLHTYRRRGQLYNFEKTGQGPLYILTGVAGDVRYPGLWVDHPWDEKKAPQPETDNYLILEAEKDKLEISVFLPSGEEIDRVSLNK